MLMCLQNLVKFCPLVLKILSGNENYDGMTELQKDGITELQKDIQGKSSIAPTFSKRGYNKETCMLLADQTHDFNVYVCMLKQRSEIWDCSCSSICACT